MCSPRSNSAHQAGEYSLRVPQGGIYRIAEKAGMRRKSSRSEAHFLSLGQLWLSAIAHTLSRSP
jgi:hypothetical protein